MTAARCRCRHTAAQHYRDRRGRPMCVYPCGCAQFRPAPTTPPADQVGKTWPSGAPILTDAHWTLAADAVTTHRGEAVQVASVARAIADAEHRGRSTLPIASELAYRLADDAIGLFLEFRDHHACSESEARAAARSEVADGASVELLPDTQAGEDDE